MAHRLLLLRQTFTLNLGFLRLSVLKLYGQTTGRTDKVYVNHDGCIIKILQSEGRKVATMLAEKRITISSNDRQ